MYCMDPENQDKQSLMDQIPYTCQKELWSTIIEDDRMQLRRWEDNSQISGGVAFRSSFFMICMWVEGRWTQQRFCLALETLYLNMSGWDWSGRDFWEAVQSWRGSDRWRKTKSLTGLVYDRSVGMRNLSEGIRISYFWTEVLWRLPRIGCLGEENLFTLETRCCSQW